MRCRWSAVLAAAWVSAAACGGDDGPVGGGADAVAGVPGVDATDAAEVAPDLPPPMPDGIPAWQEARALDLLSRLCAMPLDGRNPMHVVAHLACRERLGSPDVPADSVPPDAFDAVFDKMYRLKDTSDFDACRLVNLLYAAGDHPALPAVVRTRIEDALASFKYWFSDPTPAREADGKPVRDTMWYWSENHVLIFRTVEFLMGQRFPDRTFAVTGQTGAWHRDRARPEILRWLDERARWGFTEWHSDVYYNWDMNPLISLVEWSDDPEVARRAAMVLDLFWLDVALHVHRGNMGVTHGRSYIKDKPAAVLQDTFDATKLFFDDTSVPWRGGVPGAATLFARSRKYAMPYAVRAVALSDAAMEDRERMNLPVPEQPPAAPGDPVPPPPYGLTWGEEALALWWSAGAMTAWPVLPMTLDVATRYGLWDTQFEPISVVSSLLDLSQPVNVLLEQIHPVYSTFWRLFNSGLLTEVHTRTFRSADAMLSSAQDYRAGSAAMQVHAWQATLSEAAVVFTTHPGKLPVPEGQPVPAGWNWGSSDEHGAGYWTGDSSLPRIGQHRDLAVILYAPQYAPKPLGLAQFDYRDETHAYFPHAHFDEVAGAGQWTFGRKDGGFVGLWSHRPTRWREGQPEVFGNAGKPFDLVADGAQNAWVVMVGDAAEWGAFAAFREALAASGIRADPVADAGGDGFADGFRVTWQAPRRGTVGFGWNEPLVVDGEEVPLRFEERFDNPFVRAEFDAAHYDVAAGDHRLVLDFAGGARLATPAPIAPFDWCAGAPPDRACYAARREPGTEGVALARAIADRYTDVFAAGSLGWTWEVAVLMTGMWELYRVTRDARYFDYIRAWMDRNLEMGYVMFSSDSASPAQAAAYLFMETGDPKYRKVVEDALHYVDEVATRTEDGGINHWGTADFPGATLWVDSLFMVGTLLTRWGEYAGEAARLDEMGRQIRVFADHLQSEGGLFVHAYNYGKPVDTDIWWGRGNGWVSAAGYDYLRARRDRGEADAAAEAILAAHAKGVLATQDAASGQWWIVLNRPGETYLETSTGALFAYGLARGWRSGYLGSEVLPAIARAMAGVRGALTKDALGRPVVSGVSVGTEAGTFEYYESLPVADDLGYGVGAVLLALVETSGLPMPVP
ncbi:MAG: glycoside hydrolase family 88 protein [Deltaproteobacteria bacterium]|nr:glycoside hydrolase family 88 protein [Deltaproteobacteria bacterium]